MAPRPIRILFCTGRVTYCGVEKLRLSLLRHLDPAKYQHHILCQVATGPLADQMRAAGAEITEYGAIPSVAHPHRFRVGMQVVRRWQPDIIHGAVIEGYTLGGVLGLLSGVPAILEETSYPVERPWRGTVLTWWMAAMARHCIAVSPQVAGYLMDQLRVPRAKVSMIPNAVELPPASSGDTVAEARARVGLAAQDIVIGSAGHILEHPKRFSDLLRALAELRDLPGVKLLIVGDGPDLASLQRLALEMGLQQRVIFAGFQPNMTDWYRLMDVFALSSETESFGMAIAEAMLAGLPVVATRVGGIPYVVSEGETALLVPPRRPGELAQAIRTLAADRGLRERLGRAGRAKALQQFSVEHYAAQIEALYQQVVDRDHPS